MHEIAGSRAAGLCYVRGGALCPHVNISMPYGTRRRAKLARLYLANVTMPSLKVMRTQRTAKLPPAVVRAIFLPLLSKASIVQM
jgi:hypothetical protein